MGGHDGHDGHVGHGGHDGHEIMTPRNEPAQRASFLVLYILGHKNIIECTFDCLYWARSVLNPLATELQEWKIESGDQINQPTNFGNA